MKCSVSNCSGDAVSKSLCRKHYWRMRRNGSPLAGRAEEGAGIVALEAALNSNDPACITVRFGVSSAGYSTVKLSGKRVGLHRLACERAHGPAPFPEAQAAHRCGVRACINPKHLYWATPSENARDAKIHGTSSEGERHGSAKLTTDAVRLIRSDIRTHREIAEEYGVAEATVWAVIHGKTWKGVR